MADAGGGSGAAGLTSEALAAGGQCELPERADVYWRPRVDERALRRIDRRWTANTVAHELPFIAIAIGMPLLSPLMLPVSVAALAFALVIPRLYAARGAGVLRPPRRRSAPEPERRALGLLGDLVGHDARAVLTATGFVVEPGRLGVWLVGPAGVLLVRSGGCRVQCYCVRATGDDLPASDRIAHLLLALRADEAGFATVANLTFSGACRRLRGRLGHEARAGLDAAVSAARARSRGTARG